jgi:hypothetical protein
LAKADSGEPQRRTGAMGDIPLQVSDFEPLDRLALVDLDHL